MQRRKELIELITEYEKRIKKYPAGKIHVKDSRGRIQYYLRKNSKEISGKYLSKKQNKTIKLYLQKQYDEEVIKVLQNELNLIDKQFSKSENTVEKIQSIYSRKAEAIKNEIEAIDMSDNDFALLWKASSYVGKALNEETISFKTDRGEYVRSKSELNIANMLNKNNIPYKYECPLKLKNGYIIYPDFTVLNVNERKEIYWEHRGMMDDREYAKHSVARIKDYMKNEILRHGLNELTRNTFGFDFEGWVTGGYFEGDYIPYSYEENGKVIANASANRRISWYSSFI